MSTAVADTEPVRVLVVDDQPAFLNAARAVVERTPGFEVVAEATTGLEALELVSAVAPDLVLMDVQMPLLDGVTTARRLVEQQSPSAVVLMSSYERADLPTDLGTARVAFVAKEDLAPETLVEAWTFASSRQRPR